MYCIRVWSIYIYLCIYTYAHLCSCILIYTRSLKCSFHAFISTFLQVSDFHGIFLSLMALIFVLAFVCTPGIAGPGTMKVVLAPCLGEPWLFEGKTKQRYPMAKLDFGANRCKHFFFFGSRVFAWNDNSFLVRRSDILFGTCWKHFIFCHMCSINAWSVLRYLRLCFWPVE